MKLIASVARALLLTLCALTCAVPATANTVEYVHTDALGSIVAVTDANRNVIERREYEPFGYQLTPTLQNGPGFTGHVQDAATGMTYMQQRYYDPVIGRFLSVDPVDADGASGGNFNRYWYANNSPYRHTDPDGRIPLDTIWDIGNVVYDLGKAGVGYATGDDAMVTEGLTDAALDTAAVFIPYVPAGTQKIGRMAIKAGDDVADAGRRVPNPNGRNGGPAHQDKIDEVAADIEARDLTPAREYHVPTPGGNKEKRFVDVAALDKDGNPVEFHQVGRSRQDGSPIARERRSNEDVNAAQPEVEQFYHPYDR
jgi:RHS repeat-associated protein